MPDQQRENATFSVQTRRQLLYLARQSIADYLFRMRTASFVLVETQAAVKAGAFVTLSRDGQLRGCIGIVDALESVPLVVREMAVAAAMRDPRFDPVQPEELVLLDIEISILSPLRKIDSYKELRLGVDGVMVRAERHQGLLLPQVAQADDWTLEKFLGAACRKAGLDPEFWKTGNPELFAFTADIFSEEDLVEHDHVNV